MYAVLLLVYATCFTEQPSKDSGLLVCDRSVVGQVVLDVLKKCNVVIFKD